MSVNVIGPDGRVATGPGAADGAGAEAAGCTEWLCSAGGAGLDLHPQTRIAMSVNKKACCVERQRPRCLLSEQSDGCFIGATRGLLSDRKLELQGWCGR